MKELNTKIGVFLITYTQVEIDDEINKYVNNKDMSGCDLFSQEIRSFNIESSCCISRDEAIELTGLEIKAKNNSSQDLYTNYKGNPFDIPVQEASLHYTDPISSLKSAFVVAAPNFDFDKDFFLPRIMK
jgi:hypothetical protein